MNFNWQIIGDKVFGILKGSGFSIQMFDKTGAKTLDPHEATRFFGTIKSNDPELKNYSILVGVHDENAMSHIDIKTPKLKNQKDFDFIHKIKNSLQRNIGDREGLSVNWLKFDHSIQPKDDIVNNITESKDISKPFGSTKSSYQRIGNSKLIIRHTDSINEEKKGSRWRHVKAIFVENSLGERLMYPHMHIAGARAMARHFSNNGIMHDTIGEAIQNLSSDYMDLKKSAKLLRSAGNNSKTDILREALRKINSDVKRLSGPRGYIAVTDSFKEQQIEENMENFDSLYSELLETIGCDPDSDDAKSLKVAAKYINKQPLQPEITVKFLKTPDISSEISNYPDRKDRLAWQIGKLAEAVDNDELSAKLVTISSLLKQHGIVSPDDVETVKLVFKASRGLPHHINEADSTLDRIKALSGL